MTTPDSVKISSIASDVGATATDIAPPAESPRDTAPASVSRRLIPLTVASALLMEFVDSTALSTALPTLAKVFGSDPIYVKLALTSYLLALAIFVPASGWIADRFEAKRVFLGAMAVFLTGSVWCGLSHSLTELVMARILQGIGGALMVPVGRIIVVGTAPREKLVSALTWFTIPALIGPLIGPPIAGFIMSFADWRWIFFINLPIGLVGMIAVMVFVPTIATTLPGRFDVLGFLLAAIGISAAMGFMEIVDLPLMPKWVLLLLPALAIASLMLCARHCLRTVNPILNLKLLRIGSYKASLLGGTLVRLGLGTAPFLMPLLLQDGIGWSPAKAGLVTISAAAGALICKPVVAPLLRCFGFRKTLLWSVLGCALLTALPALYHSSTPLWFIIITLAISGFMRSMQYTSTNSIAYADVDKHEISQASTLATVTQQIAMSLGITFGAQLLHLSRGGAAILTPEQFILPFMAAGIVTLFAIPVYWRLHTNAGAAIAGR